MAIDFSLRLPPEQLHLPIEAHTQIAGNLDTMNYYAGMANEIAARSETHVEMGFGIKDLGTYVGRCWDQVKDGSVPEFGKIYQDMQQEKELALSSEKSRALANDVLSQREEYFAGKTEEAVERLSRFSAPTPTMR